MLVERHEDDRAERPRLELRHPREVIRVKAGGPEPVEIGAKADGQKRQRDERDRAKPRRFSWIRKTWRMGKGGLGVRGLDAWFVIILKFDIVQSDPLG